MHFLDTNCLLVFDFTLPLPLSIRIVVVRIVVRIIVRIIVVRIVVVLGVSIYTPDHGPT